MVQTTTQSIKMFVEDLDQRDWDEYAERLTFAINTAQDRIRGDTPFYLVHGCDPRSTLEATIPLGRIGSSKFIGRGTRNQVGSTRSISTVARCYTNYSEVALIETDSVRCNLRRRSEIRSSRCVGCFDGKLGEISMRKSWVEMEGLDVNYMDTYSDVNIQWGYVLPSSLPMWRIVIAPILAMQARQAVASRLRHGTP
ncbi:unnamed protein product [Phytophthora fragariaefolia]|uniref:Unnamed protein product n=1 Tax=Phytophthora fragariaefolia TaxID=1490495 RepID=A0A9W7DEL9_9STRA|nr:unnamed protein product [Phytophthora fragariaefolia]